MNGGCSSYVTLQQHKRRNYCGVACVLCFFFALVVGIMLVGGRQQEHSTKRGEHPFRFRLGRTQTTSRFPIVHGITDTGGGYARLSPTLAPPTSVVQKSSTSNVDRLSPCHPGLRFPPSCPPVCPPPVPPPVPPLGSLSVPPSVPPSEPPSDPPLGSPSVPPSEPPFGPPSEPPFGPPSSPPSFSPFHPPSHPGEKILCSDDCAIHYTLFSVKLTTDGVCDDGLEGSLSNQCQRGTDCSDCGVRVVWDETP